MNDSTNWTDTLPGYRTKTVKRGDCTIIVHRPVLGEKERLKREGAVSHALAHLARPTKGSTHQ